MPAVPSSPRLVALNRPLCRDLGFDAEVLEANAHLIFSGRELPAGASPLAQAYAGHQFGNFVPQLGDGRALLLGEVLDLEGRRRDLQLKGSGPTPFSRRGDGRAALGPVLREFLVSEAMHALGIPTTRSLAAVLTGDPVYREEKLQGAVLTRVASSHIRVGTFEYFAAREDHASVETLARYVVQRHYVELSELERPFLRLLEAVCTRQAALVAQWMSVGFIHGVMNTDNVSIAGETIDFGPCAFLDTYHPATVFSAIDRGGRYSFANQPVVAQWNLARFAETLLPLIHEDSNTAIEQAGNVVNRFSENFQDAWLMRMGSKLGLFQADADDLSLVRDLLSAMQQDEADFTLTFRRLTQAIENNSDVLRTWSELGGGDNVSKWLPTWIQRMATDAVSPTQRVALMRASNPCVIARNHRVAEALAAGEAGNFAAFEKLHAALQKPFDVPTDALELMDPPLPHERVLRTFCGT